MHTEIIALDKKGYRKFGVVTGTLVLVLFGLAIPYLFDHPYPRWPWYFAAVLVACARLAPMALKYPYQAWMRFGLVMGWINTRLILGILFFGMFFPISLLFKLLGKDPMRRKLDRNVASYKEFNELESKHNLERPY